MPARMGWWGAVWLPSMPAQNGLVGYTFYACTEWAGGVLVKEELVRDLTIRGQAGSKTQARELLVCIIILQFLNLFTSKRSGRI